MEELRQAIAYADQQARALHQQGKTSEAAETAAWASQYAREHLSPDDELRRRVAMNAAALKESAGDRDAAVALYGEAADLADAARDPETLTQAFRRVFAIRAGQNQYEAAAQAGERALTLWRVGGEPPTAEVLTFMNDLANMHYRSGAEERAAALLEEIITQRHRLFPEDTKALALALLNLGTLRQSQGNFVSAESHMLSALDMRRRTLPPNHPALMEAILHVSGLYVAQEDYRRAIPYEEEALAIARRRAVPLDLARSINNLATLYYRDGDVAGSRPLYEEALAVIAKVHGQQHADTASAKGNLANVLRRLADFDGAEQLLRDVIATRRAVLGDLDGEVAIAVDDLTELFREKRSATELERCYRDVLGIVLRYAENPTAPTSRLLGSLRKIERAHAALVPNRPRSLAHTEALRLQDESIVGIDLLARLMHRLNESTLAAALFSAASTNAASQTHAWSLARQGLAAAYRDANQPGEAESVCDEYVAAVRAGWHAPPDHYAMVLWTRSQLLELRRDTGAAIAAMQESVAQMERAAARGAAVDLAGGLLRLAELSLSGGELAAASELATRVLDEARAAGDSVASAGARAVLAHVARIEGRFVDAETLFRAALGPMLAIEPTWKAALLLRDFGVLYISCNDTANGVPLITRAVAMARDLYGIRSWQHATMLTTLAEVKSTAGPMHEAAPLFVDVADIATKIGSHELLARALRGSGSLYTRIGAWQAAEHMLTRALDQMALYSAPAEEVANVEADLAMVEARFDKYEAACERIDRVIGTLREKRIGGGRLGSATRTKMWILGRMRRWDQAFDAARETSDAFEKELQQSVSIAPGRGRDQIADALYRQLDVVLSLALRLRTPAAIAEACERTLRWKGAALTWGAANVQALAVSTVAELKALRQDLIDVRRAMIRWSLSGPGKSTRRSTTLEELHRREEALDREINRHLASLQGRTDSRLHVNVQTVSAALPVSGVLIDFVRYESIDFERGRSSDRLHRGNDRYAAFIVRAGAGPVLVDIGDAETVDRAVSRFRSCVTGEADDGGIVRRGENVDDRVRPGSSDAREPPPEDEWIPAGIDLRGLVFDPLLDAIGPCTRLSIAQHGELSRLPFAALPIDNGYLLDRYELTYLDTGRDLLRRVPDVSAPGNPLVIADPDFDLELLTVPASHRQQPFEPLSETREEGAFVAAALGVAPLMGAEATEGRLRSAQSPRILHIATHGFFLADDRPPRPGNVADVATLISIPGFGNHLVQLIDKPRDIEEGEDLDPFTRLGRLSDPMLRSGVALAGSNTWASGAMLSSGDDGLLTAAEIALLDFTATDLAVLSACETGLGEVRRGEGVFGLRRAFAIAGAQTLVMSVWNIPSDQTRDLVIEFYRQLTAGKAVAQAFGDAQRAMRKIAPHPVNWAGLLCIGKPPA